MPKKEGENHVFDKNRLDEYAQYVFHIVDFLADAGLFFNQVLVAAALHPDNQSDPDQRHRRQQHQAVVLVKTAVFDVPARRNNLIPPQGSGPEQFAEKPEDQQDNP